MAKEEINVSPFQRIPGSGAVGASSDTANVTCTARDALGNVIPNAVSVPILNPLGPWADYLFPAPTGQRGALDCSSNAKVGAIGLRALGTNAISTLPVITIR